MTAFSEGLLGEWRARAYLRRQGMAVLAQRYRAPHGEIDLIARDQQAIVFVEVKARPRGTMGVGLTAVGAEKRRRLRAAAQHYLLSHPAENVRFDVIEISAAGLRHIKNAF